MTDVELAKSATYFYSLRYCIFYNMKKDIKIDASADTDFSPTKISWFDGNDDNAYVYPDGKKNCKDITQEALSLWEIDPGEFLTALGYKNTGGNNPKWQTSNEGQARYDKVKPFVQSKIGGDPGNATDAGNYRMYFDYFFSRCEAKDLGVYSSLSSTDKSRVDSNYVSKTSTSAPFVSGSDSIRYRKISIADGDSTTQHGFTYASSSSITSTGGTTSAGASYIAYGYHSIPSQPQVTTVIGCEYTAQKIGDLASKYVEFAKAEAMKEACEAQGYENISGTGYVLSTLNACIGGMKNQKDPTYCATSWPDTAADNNKAERDACAWGQNTTPPQAESPQIPPSTTSTSPTCGDQVSGMGWLICPLIDGLTGLNDMVWNAISGLLKVSPLRTDGSQSIYSAWGILRNIANVAFIITFMIMIFSQLTNVGVSNYGVKKLLPRLLISALLVNLSFFIVQIAVDVANILGSSLYDLLTGLEVNGSQPPSWTGLMDIILGAATGGTLAVGALILAGGVAGAFWLLLPIAAMGALSVLAAIFTLIFRQAVIPILAILAPLAFVAYMLPNTESWFKKWRDLLISMLMLYPLAAVVFGGAQFASAIIIGAGDNANWWSTLLGLIVLTMPLFSLPFLARQGGPLLGKVGGALQGLANKARNPLNNFAKPYSDRAREQYRTGKKSIFGNNYNSRQRAIRRLKGKRTAGERLAEARMNVEKDIENAKSTGKRNYGRRALDAAATGRGSRAARHALKALDEEKTLGLENKAIDDQFNARLEGRRVNNARERLASDQIADAGGATKLFQQQQAERQSERIKNNAQSTVAGAIGVPGISSLGDVSQQEYFSSLRNARNEKVTESANIKAANQDPTMLDVRHETENAEAEIQGVKTAQATDLKERTVTDPRLAQLDMERRANEQAAKTAEGTSLGKYSEEVKKEGSVINTMAGGTVDAAGQAKAAAYGIDAQEKLRNETVSAHKTRLKAQSLPDFDKDPTKDTLYKRVIDKTKTPEEQEAAIRSIIEGGNIDAIKPTMDYLIAEKDDAVAAGDQARVDELQHQIQAVGETIGSSPGKSIAWGAAEIGKFKANEYEALSASGAKIPASAEPAFDALGATDKQLAATLIAKGGTAARDVPGVDKTDLKSIRELAEKGILPPGTAKDIWDKLDIALSNADIHEHIKVRETGYILRAMAALEGVMEKTGPIPQRRPRGAKSGPSSPPIKLDDLPVEFRTEPS